MFILLTYFVFFILNNKSCTTKKTFLVNFNLEEAVSFVDISDDENDELIIEEEGSHDQDDSGVRPLTNLKSAVRRKFTTAPNPQQYI